LLDLLFHLSWYNPLATHNFLLRKSDEADGPSRETEYQVQGGPPADSTLFFDGISLDMMKVKKLKRKKIEW
jgi:hypothetical protein